MKINTEEILNRFALQSDYKAPTWMANAMVEVVKSFADEIINECAERASFTLKAGEGDIDSYKHYTIREYDSCSVDQDIDIDTTDILALKEEIYEKV